MTRTMYDSVNASAIPKSAQIVAGYIDGRYAWSAADWARFPTAVHVRIAVFASTNDGHVLDVERYDATPAQAVGWVQRRRAAGADPTVYCGYSTNGYSWALVIDAFRSAGVPEPHYWIAAYPGNGARLYPGSVAHQYADPVTSGGNYDLSVVADVWPGVDPGPVGGFGSGLGTGTYTPLPPIGTAPGGFLMALTDQQQADLLADTAETLRLLRLVILAPTGGGNPQTEAEVKYVQIVQGDTANAAEARREAGVLLGALPPAPGESRPAGGATVDPAELAAAVKTGLDGATITGTLKPGA